MFEHAPMPTEIIPFAGWPRNLRPFNAGAGVIVTLHPGESASHRERWSQHVFDAPPPLDDEAALADQLWPVGRAAGIL